MKFEIKYICVDATIKDIALYTISYCILPLKGNMQLNYRLVYQPEPPPLLPKPCKPTST